MKWRGRKGSDNIVDQRSFGGRGTAMGGGTLIIGAIIYFLLGGNPIDFVAQNTDVASQRSPASVSNAEDGRKEFASVVLADTEDVWIEQFRAAGLTYDPPKLVLFQNAVRSACGSANSAVGPFYCPADRRVYLDLSFFDQLSRDLGAQGDFAGAYVIAHEIGHHIQKLLELDRSRRDNRSSVQLELQADCLAGVWAHQTEASKDVIEAGDIDEALGAAAAVGDDRLQERSQGYVVPDSFTHGTSEQRASAFRKGYSGGRLGSCVQM